MYSQIRSAGSLDLALLFVFRNRCYYAAMSYDVVKTATESFSDPTTCCDSSATRDVATFASVNNRSQMFQLLR